jgi:hypothetical protein
MNRNTGRDKIASALAQAEQAADSTGNLYRNTLAITENVYNGDKIPKADLDYILHTTALKCGWNGDAVKVRKSELRGILTQYNVLPAAIEQFQKVASMFHRKDLLNLARAIKRHNGNAKLAVKDAVDRQNRKAKPAEMTAKRAKGRATAAINQVMKLPHLSRDFKAALAKLADKYGFVTNEARTAA